MSTYTLAENGDMIEREYYEKFIKNEFPSYEYFWQFYVVPLTNRPSDIDFINDNELAKLGKGPHDICIAQLHYSVLRHLIRAFEIKSLLRIGLDLFTEGMVRICGSQDAAFDLLERIKNPGKYGPWLAKKEKSSGKNGSQQAQQKWRKKNNFPLQNIRNYRNHLVHGRFFPYLNSNNDLYLPKIGKEKSYFDWREITDNPNLKNVINQEFTPAIEILKCSWEKTLNYLESEWKKIPFDNLINQP